MCGPIVVSFSLGLREKGTLFPHLLYNSGRVITYTVLGGIMGVSGSFTVVVAHITIIQKVVMLLAGVLIIVMGLAMSGLIPLGRIFGDHVSDNVIARAYGNLTGSNSILAFLPLGLLLGLLPCGPVYTALISAARAGMEANTPIEGIYAGALVMCCFGVGTIPALFIVGRLTGMKWLKSRAMIYKIGSGVMVIVGIYFVIKAIYY
jgi:sulfite exporter TauE/SafE